MVSRSVPPVPGGTTMSYFILIPLSIMFFVNGGTWWRWLVTLVTHLEVFLHNMSRWTLPHFARLNVGLNVLGGHIQFFFFLHLHCCHHWGGFAVTSQRPRLPAEWEHFAARSTDGTAATNLLDESSHQRCRPDIYFLTETVSEPFVSRAYSMFRLLLIHVYAVCTVCIGVYCKHLPSASMLPYIINGNHDARSVCQPTFNHLAVLDC